MSVEAALASSSTMSLDRAHEIITALRAVQMETNGVFVAQGNAASVYLAGISLIEMLQAAERVRRENSRVACEAARIRADYALSVVPEDRFIAAVYVAIHHEPSDAALVVHDEKVVGVFSKALALQSSSVKKGGA